MLLEIGFVPVHMMPQIFVLKMKDKTIAVLAKVVDEILMKGDPLVTDPIIMMINAKFKLGTIIHGPGQIRFFGLNVQQFDDMSICVDADEKLHALETMPISRFCGKEID